MKSNEQKNPLSIGFISGVLVALIAWGLVQTFRESRGGETIAEMQGEKLTAHELRQQKANEFVPVENDEYRILKQGAEEWLNSRLIEKEAKAQGISTDELYRKELWNQVHTSSADAVDFYNTHKELFDQPFEQVSSQIAQELRRKEYARVKDEFLEKLRNKYSAKILISKPKSYVEGLALAYDQPGTAEPSQPTPAPTAEQAEAQPSPQQPTVSFDDLDGRPSQGPKNAPITLVEFSDFHCPFCSRVEPTMQQLMDKYKGKIRRVWRHYPLPMHTGSERTHQASECANEQGKFWEYHDKLFATQGESREDNSLIDLAKQVGLNTSKFQQCLTSEKYKEVVQKDMTKGSSVGVEGTPSVFVNGEMVAGAYPFDYFVNLIERKLNPGLAPPAPAAAPAAQPEEPQAPQAVVQFDDLEGKPSQGPKNAPITLVEFSDFHCPFCSRMEPTMQQLMDKYKGKIRRVWRHYPLPMHTGADRTHEASQCAAEQGKFWEYHDKLFATQGGARDDNALTDLAKQVGANQSKFQECLTSGRYKNLIQQEVAKGSQSGVQGTPSVFVNGEMVAGAYPVDYFVNMIEKKLNPGRAPSAPAPAPTAQGPAPSPGAVVTFNDLEGKPSQGPKNAPITLVEFSDFHCPFCSRVEPTIDQLMSNYKGKIHRVWRHYPLPMHTGADRTHAASQCAAEQDKFWEYHDKLFATQGGARDDNALTDLAKQVGLKEKKFKECLESGKYKNLIQQEVSKGSQVGVRGTPSFFVNGQLVVGAKPYASFDQIIQSELNKAKS